MGSSKYIQELWEKQSDMIHFLPALSTALDALPHLVQKVHRPPSKVISYRGFVCTVVAASAHCLRV